MGEQEKRKREEGGEEKTRKEKCEGGEGKREKRKVKEGGEEFCVCRSKDIMMF